MAEKTAKGDEAAAIAAALARFQAETAAAPPGAPATAFEDDIFLATRLALNDVEDTELLAGVVIDLEHQERVFSLEFERRLSDNLNLEIEGQVFDNVDEGDLLNGLGDDSFIEVRLSWFF